MPLLTVRTAVVLLISAVAGIVAFVLSYLAGKRNTSAAGLVAFGAAGAALVMFNDLLGP